MNEKKYLIDNELVSAQELITDAATINEAFRLSPIKTTSQAAEIIRRSGRFVDEAPGPEAELYDEEIPFQAKLRDLINHYSLENYSNTPDFVLAKYMCECLDTFNRAVTARAEFNRANPTKTPAPIGFPMEEEQK